MISISHSDSFVLYIFFWLLTLSISTHRMRATIFICMCVCMCLVRWLGFFSAVYDHFSSWKITLNCLVVIRKFFFRVCWDLLVCMTLDFDITLLWTLEMVFFSSLFFSVYLLFVGSLISPNDEHDSYFKTVCQVANIKFGNRYLK